ncbi:MAG: DNA polymerase III subunit delta [Deltaproteobacteria bacterium]|nr:DNA polymerase III subunit delta [Deltaproteobacteria bacterium]
MAKSASPEEFLALLEGDAALPPIVAFGGAERVFVDDALAAIRAKVLVGGLADFNHDRTGLKDKRANEIISMAKTLPVMAKQRLVEVRDADAAVDVDVTALSAYFESPNPETVLCLVFGDIDLRDKLPKLLDKSKNALICRFDHPKDREMPGLVARRAKKLKLKLQPGAADALAITVGTDLTLLERALEKLAIAVEGDISADDVSKHIADTHLEDAFAFVRHVATGNREPAIKATAALQAAREEPLRLLGLLAWQLRQVAQARGLLDEGKDAARELNLFGDRAGPVLTAARKFDPARHAQRLVLLADADVALKSSRQPAWLLMTRLVQELTTPPPASAARPAQRQR